MRILFTLSILYSLSSFVLANDFVKEAEWGSSTSLMDTSFVDVADTVILQISDCAGLAQLCVNLPIEDIPNYQLSANGTPYGLGFIACDFDTILQYAYSNLDAPGPYRLDSWLINNVQQASANIFNDGDELANFMNTVDPMGNWINDPINNWITGGTEGNTYSQMQVFQFNDLSTKVLLFSELYPANGTSLNFQVGATQFVITESLTGLSDTFNVEVVCVLKDTLNINILIGDTTEVCIDFNELFGEVDTVYNICPTASGSSANALLVNGDSCIAISTIAGGTDLFCMVACDTFGVCDTTTFVVNVTVPGTPGTVLFLDTISAGIGELFCVNTGVFSGTPDTMYNLCPSSSGESVALFLNQNTFCVSYNGFVAGTDTACIVVCDDLNICDTTLMFITVESIETLQASFFYDTLFINTNDVFCNFDLSELDGDLDSINNACAGNSGGFVDFMVDTINNCVTYSAANIGKDTACIYLTDDLGNQDTLFMVVCVQAPTTDLVIDTLRLELSVNYCLDISQLGGAVMDTIYFCGPTESDVITIVPDDLSLCIDVTANNIGTDTFCVYICDDLGICDTTIFQITVNDDEVMGAPIANSDRDTTFQNTAVVTNVCGNDELPGNTLTSFFVLPMAEGGIGPLNGAAFVNNDCTINYVPNNNFCGEEDLYTYVICNSAGCDTTTVAIYITCPSTELIIYNGFSPNGDSFNDFFFIEGIETLPNNTLTIYNRWGNQLFKLNSYNNNSAWDGTWEGVDLPDGVYYYFLDHGDGESTTGWVVMSR